MNSPASDSFKPIIRLALTVINSGAKPVLCPFFGTCDGLLILDAAKTSREFHANDRRTPASLCTVIMAAKPDGLVCGYIGEAEKQTLRSAGIDVRLGSCAWSIEDLVARYPDLPAA